ncbi:transposase [Nonomuraea dietziae]|uniref:transposase n=1 Tax=Nonomuraea dietziae TaxID=65515 RepID=UPI003F4E0063
MSERKPYSSDLSDERWALIEPVITAWKAAHPSVSDQAVHDLLRRQSRPEPGGARHPERARGGGGAGRHDRQGADKKVHGRKRGLAVDVLGQVIAVVVLAVSAQENTAGTALLDRLAVQAPTVQVVTHGVEQAYGTLGPRHTPR